MYFYKITIPSSEIQNNYYYTPAGIYYIRMALKFHQFITLALLTIIDFNPNNNKYVLTLVLNNP